MLILFPDIDGLWRTFGFNWIQPLGWHALSKKNFNWKGASKNCQPFQMCFQVISQRKGKRWIIQEPFLIKLTINHFPRLKWLTSRQPATDPDKTD